MHRLIPSNWQRLPLALSILVAGYGLALLGGLVWADPIIAVDLRLADLLVSLRTVTLTHAFTALTLLGKSFVVLMFCVALVAVLLLWRKRGDLVTLAIVIVGSTTTSWLSKIAFQRPRPEQAIYLESSYSFPSGHATIAVAFYGFVGYLLIRSASRRTQKIKRLGATLTLIIAIGLSRLYLGEHYLSDVLAGYLIGTLWLIIALASGQGLGRFPAFSTLPSLAPITDRKGLTGLAIALALAGYLAIALTYQMPLTGP
ncbi:phosphatase PAP2 family protein [Reinekea sp.]|jgi:undecaprenyl-diphosphatase|uniref:phosphatase PAP2 family protein n=1 Tax=Reinekea sp. TaxID=1970455 RepID=UPI002A800716|nr:phosphatase PAP2 family protein [Reinekea sp.]